VILIEVKTSDNGIAFIARWEGEILKEYLDVVGKRTVGIGHLCGPNEHFGTITHEQAVELLKKDLAIAEAAVNSMVKVPLNQNMFDSLVSFTFNLGTGALQKSTLLICLNKVNYESAANEFPKWCNAGGKPNAGILNRRISEKQLFLKPVPAEPVEVVPTEIRPPIQIDPAVIVEPLPTPAPVPVIVDPNQPKPPITGPVLPVLIASFVAVCIAIAQFFSNCGVHHP
jgi:lysozyme